ncbi:YsnF/AvaK domain-containing protein [Planosporangium thailandense]|uniref:YsnF/AvaK domain-containing protein n=1 Tax=Planosporangium thailandense TaxID=765197 RepID=A0ABX0XYQ3_9ACTN|nr:YsnF/AvaK domain-containing protein [Planosporangium thailandense]NJC71191.1 YsnF/AvaK domain-containing protein [Planosporangium thailandense]
MLRTEELQRVAGHDVYDRNDDKIGSFGQIFVDVDTREPEWVSVRTGLFGLKESFVPLDDAEITGETLHVPYEKDQVKEAPKIEPEAGELSPDKEQELCAYYGNLGWHSQHEGEAAATGAAPGTGVRERTERDRERGGEAMTRSEEHLRVGTERVEAGRVRLRKYVTTEEEQVTVPVEREVLRVEREPISEAERATAATGPEFTESEQEVILHEERPVVSKESTPVERVRLGKEKVVEEQTVRGEVRKEHIEEEVPGETRAEQDRPGEERSPRGK